LSFKICLFIDLGLQVLHAFTLQLADFCQPEYLTLSEYFFLGLDWGELFDYSLYLFLLVLHAGWKRVVVSVLGDVLELCDGGDGNFLRFGLDSTAIGCFRG
jgi:hypothetical protein